MSLDSVVTTGAKILGVTVDQALEAYGVYFLRYIAAQVSMGVHTDGSYHEGGFWVPGL